MSLTDTYGALDNFSEAKIYQELAKNIGKNLQQLFPNEKEAYYSISKKIRVNYQTVWNWYNGLHLPNTINLLRLSSIYPEILKSLLDFVGRRDIWDGYENYKSISEIDLKKYQILEKSEIYTDIFVGINMERNIKLNQRQLWFIKKLQLGINVNAKEIIRFWNVSSRTAERDISELTKHQIIKFVGAKKNGRYVLKQLLIP